ncbi:hypothetical protein NXT3_CH00202 [Sinorhizobium fredii]|nr:hypothetical protein NXT3_CH00202 [Sinorhizobium fredii]
MSRPIAASTVRSGGCRSTLYGGLRCPQFCWQRVPDGRPGPSKNGELSLTGYASSACLICNHGTTEILGKCLFDLRQEKENGVSKMKIRQKIMEYAKLRRAVRELNALDDHALSDIGLSRSQIQAAVYGR